jgi:hypothetical protein
VDERAFDGAWARIEEAAPVSLDPSRVGEVVLLAVALHPDRVAIIERTRTARGSGSG